jgi:serine/threonine-protein kinase
LSDAAENPSPRPSARGLALVVGVGFVHALWALFQWTQLVAARTGGSSFCGIGDSSACTDIWDSAFASTIQGWTGVPIAGWGLIWSVAAVALPLWALAQRASEVDQKRERVTGSAWAGTVWIALAGIGAIVVLFAASVMEGQLCTTCVVTYTIVAIYAAICFVQTPLRSVPLAKGVSLASGALGLAFVLLFIPGLRTPLSQAEAGKQVLEQIAQQDGQPDREQEEAESAASANAPPSGPHGAPPLEDSIASLSELLDQLPPDLKQAFSDELHRFSKAEHVPLRKPRALIGPSTAPVRITEFTDVLCGHCATLHDTVTQLSQAVPPGSFSLEARHFPLDSACNPELEGESTNPLRCVAAKSVICMEGRTDAFDYAGRLYKNQRTLSEDAIYELAGATSSRDELASCVNDDATLAKLHDDIAWASEHDIHGTPLVLINGRPVAAFGPLLYALILTGGDAEHPVFAMLPTPKPPKPHDHKH